jgi:hypothetical protein
MVRPQQNVKEIVDFVGERGIIAGGAIRDIILERTPKDYDLFIFKQTWYEEIVGQKGIFDKVPEPALQQSASNMSILLYGNFLVYNTTLYGQDVQIIYSPDFESSMKKGHITEEGIIQRFPFTVNMVYVNRKHKIIVGSASIKAFSQRQMIYNPNHRTSSSRPCILVPHLYRRVFYLADKLGYTIPQATLDAIDRDKDYEDELSNRIW